MEKADKIIKYGSLLALLLAILAFGRYFYDNFRFFEILADQTGASLAAKPVKALFLGDIMLDRHVGEKIKSQGVDYLLSGLKKDKFDFSGYDMINANLEGAVTDNGAHYSPTLENDFSFSPSVLENLKKYNFKFFNLANNHSSDQGERGIKETAANLSRLQLNYYGCADGKTGDCSFATYQAGDLKIGLAGFSMVYRKFDQSAAEKIIRDLKNKTDFVAVNLHWGTEYTHNFGKSQEEVAHRLIDAGADMVIGHHPHVVQGVELYKNKPIFYSLGNFIFDQYFSADTQEELAVEALLLPERRLNLKLLPLKSKQSQPGLMTGQEKSRYLEKIASWSKGGEKLMKEIKAGEIRLDF